MQDVEFWGLSAVSQLGRRRTGTVSLGGNGQFTRLSALLSLGERPWSKSLTEDLDLAISLAIDGWQLTMPPTCFVDQQAVKSISALLKQRTRWFQGHMTCSKRMGEVLRSRNLSNRAAMEICAYLMVPYGLTLPWSILGQWALYQSVARLSTYLSPSTWNGSTVLPFLYAIGWYLIGFAPTLLTGFFYGKRSGVSKSRSIFLAHVLLVYNYLMYWAAWRALIRMLWGGTSWTKTDRVIEKPQVVENPPVVLAQ